MKLFSLKILSVLSLLIFLNSCSSETNDINLNQLNLIMDDWHKAASKSNINDYFNRMDDDFIFLGTDSSERWNKTEFREFCLPHFKKNNGWDFKSNWRKWNNNQEKNTVWFEESLNTWMGDCRGSGVLELIDNQWILKQYNLSVTVDNDLMNNFIELKKNSIKQNK